VSDLPTITKAAAPGDVWAIDFQFHSTSAGKPLKILSIVDEHTGQALGGQVEYSITASDLIDQLDVLTIEHDSPKALRMDNGPEFISKALRKWANEVDLVFIPPGQPWRNGFIESSNGRLRDECLSVNQFYSLNHAKASSGFGRRITTRPGRIHRWDIWPPRFMLNSAPTELRNGSQSHWT
jgi:transposase InsO family protein